MSTSPQIVQHESIPHSYQHPYLFTKSKDQQTLYAWSNSDPSHSHQSTPLQTERIDIAYTLSHLLAEKYVLIQKDDPPSHQTLLLFSLNDGSLSDTKTIVNDSNPNDPAHRPLPGDSAFLGLTKYLVAVFKNGTSSKDGIIEIYGVSDEGKFVLKNELQQPSDGPALVENVDNKTWGASGYTLPTCFHFDERTFIGGFEQHSMEIVKWSSQPQQPSLLELPGSRFIDGLRLQSWLNAKLYIPVSDSLLIAHYESPLDFVDYAPITSIRSISPDTMELKWCSPIGHKTERLRYNGKLNILISFGCAGERDSNSNEPPPKTGIFILDAETGAVRRQVRTDTRCDTSPSGEELVFAYDDGRVLVISLASFIENGLPEEHATKDEGSSNVSSGILFRSPAFYPELEPETPLNSKGRAKERKAVEMYAELGQARPWVDGLFVGDGIVLLKGTQKLGYVAIRWK
ncbi:hypothetical protein QCA50_017494 [Cerrena zonata]|uniref:Uncharacterized protein n=1 Tax=Cerrena zonata TaxID=2478898 RepID=A0AAW0FD43_9APHY